MENFKKIRGRGSEKNTSGRFDKLQREDDLSHYNLTGSVDEEEFSNLKTEFFKDVSRTIVTENTSPDIPFRYSLNAYRGCEHGCSYCYARPTHEYLGLSAGLDFESKIFVKEEAPALLREKLMSPNWKAECITMSGVTDCYQPAERKYEITRRCLQVFLEFLHPVALITKNHLILRDLDILKELAAEQLVEVYISVTSLDPDLARDLEPRTSAPSSRLKAIEELAKAGVPVGVNIAPVIPGLTDHEMPAILKAAHDAGAKYAGYVPLRLPYSVTDIFAAWLEAKRPNAKEKVLKYVKEFRGGKLNDPNFNSRMRGVGKKADDLRQMFHLFSKRYRFNEEELSLRTDKFRRPGDQLRFF